MKNGLIYVFTGGGKGKTTAAVGLAVRANAHKIKVSWVSFHKSYACGELRNLKKLGVKVRCFARYHPRCKKEKRKNKQVDLRKECLKGMRYIKKIFKNNDCRLLVLDEINICLRDGYLKENEVLELISLKPADLELVLTGRGATKKLLQQADLISDIREVKHPFRKGIKARKGIEY